MSFLANLNSFFLANEVAVVTVVAAGLVLFQLALLALTSWECDSESWLAGSLTVEKQLHQCADEFMQQWSDLRQWVNTQSGEVHRD